MMKKGTYLKLLLSVFTLIFVISCSEDPSMDPTETCGDGIMNQDETGVDCGGVCQDCGVDPTCNDGIQNQNETGVDCGGVCTECEEIDYEFNIDQMLYYRNNESETKVRFLYDNLNRLSKFEFYSEGFWDIASFTYYLFYEGIERLPYLSIEQYPDFKFYAKYNYDNHNRITSYEISYDSITYETAERIDYGNNKIQYYSYDFDGIEYLNYESIYDDNQENIEWQKHYDQDGNLESLKQYSYGSNDGLFKNSINNVFAILLNIINYDEEDRIFRFNVGSKNDVTSYVTHNSYIIGTDTINIMSDPREYSYTYNADNYPSKIDFKKIVSIIPFDTTYVDYRLEIEYRN